MAALAVVLVHAVEFAHAGRSPLGRILLHLDVGVPVFFAITGFLLYRPLLAASLGDAPRTPTRVFYWRRFLRVVPAYWVALIVLAPTLTFATPLGIPNAAYLQIYHERWVKTGIIPAWTLCVEVSFYLLLPAFAFVLDRAWSGLTRAERRHREFVLLGVLAVASIVLRQIGYSSDTDRFIGDLLPTTLGWFCGGMFLAVLSADEDHGESRIRRFVRTQPVWVWVAALAIYAVVSTTRRGMLTDGAPLFVAYGLIGMLMLAPLVLSDPRSFAGGRLALARPMAWLGLISYGIYLYHYPLMVELHLSGGSPTVRILEYAALGVAISVTCGALSYYVVERPALRLKRVRERPRLQRLLGLS
jgi:peptidoglycan/LPS O-acetylase OafA/YrhL